MSSDDRFLNSIYRQQARSDRVSKEIDEDIANGGGEEELSRVFDKLLQAKMNDSVNYTVAGAYVSYQHETVKSAINVV